MFNQYFGGFLLNRSIISAEQLQHAMSRLDKSNVKLGVLAVNSGFLTVEEVESIHALQGKMDKKFGEIAVAENLLKQEQVDMLLATQKTGYLQLGQVLLDEGMLSLTQLERALADYKSNSGMSELLMEALISGEMDAILPGILKLENIEHAEVLRDYVSLFIRNLIRFIDPAPMVEKEIFYESYEVPWCAYQTIAGPLNILSGLSAGESVLLKIAEKYADMEFDSLDDPMAVASLGEFMNLHNGIFLVNLSDRGIECNLAPQMTDGPFKFGGNGKKVIIIPIYISMDRLELIISI